MSFSLDPAAILLVLAGEVLYLRAVRVLARRGYRVPVGQQTAWHAGVGCTAIGLLSPIDSLGEELLIAHMGQHLLIADISAPLLLIGIRSPVFAFILPRPVLVPLARATGLRMRRGKVELPTLPSDGLHPPAPPESGSRAGPTRSEITFGSHGVEHRFVRGGFGTPGTGTDWIRLTRPLVRGEATLSLIHI